MFYGQNTTSLQLSQRTCNRTQGNAVLHLQFMDQSIPPPSVTMLGHGTRPLTGEGKPECTETLYSLVASQP